MTAARLTVVALLWAALPPQASHEPDVPLQPLAVGVRRLETALAYLGQPLPAADHAAINAALALPDEA